MSGRQRGYASEAPGFLPAETTVKPYWKR